MLITSTQLHIARQSVGFTQTALAQEVGVSRQTVNWVESGREHKSRTMRKLQHVLREHGAIFGVSGEVSVKMVWPNGRPASRRIREARSQY
jgi:DNA-binding XRE family transcriptional regulator